MIDFQKLGELAEDIAPATLPLDEATDLHVDGDYAAYYFSGNDETTIASSKRNFIDTVRNVQQVAGAGGQVIIHLTAGGSDKAGRFKIATVKPYQGQRDSSRRPKNWEAMRAWLEKGKTLEGTDWRVVIWTDREADDGVAAAARYAISVGRWPAMLARDKDFRMIPGRHVSWTTFARYEVKPDVWMLDTGEEDTNGRVLYGQSSFWMQLVAGDTADNIPGLEGQPAKKEGTFKSCGKACAEEYIGGSKSVEEAWPIVRELYRLYYGQSWADRFVEQAALLWLRTDNKADVGDFLKAIPAKSVDLERAVDRLRRRIK